MLLGAKLDVLISALPIVFLLGFCIKCHQCSSSQEAKGQDNCGAYKPFDTTKSIPVDCNSDESVTPGTFCVKITQQGPRHFVCKLLSFKLLKFFNVACIKQGIRDGGKLSDDVLQLQTQVSLVNATGV